MPHKCTARQVQSAALPHPENSLGNLRTGSRILPACSAAWDSSKRRNNERPEKHARVTSFRPKLPSSPNRLPKHQTGTSSQRTESHGKSTDRKAHAGVALRPPRAGPSRTEPNRTKPHLRSPAVEETLDAGVIPVRHQLRRGVQRLEDLDAHAVSVVLGETCLGREVGARGETQPGET